MSRVKELPNVQYLVGCWECDKVWSPEKGSKLWFMARQYERANPERLDGLTVSGHECGCCWKEKKVVENPSAPYRVSGYNELCEEFDFGFDRFTDAVRFLQRRDNVLSTIFTTGLSDRVVEKTRQLVWEDREHIETMDEARRDYQAESQKDHEEFQQGLQEFFDVAIDQVEEGKMDPNQLKPFFERVRH